MTPLRRTCAFCGRSRSPERLQQFQPEGGQPVPLWKCRDAARCSRSMERQGLGRRDSPELRLAAESLGDVLEVLLR